MSLVTRQTPRRLPFKQALVAIILLPTIISPIVAGSTWRLMFDQRFGPINQMLGWITGTEVARNDAIRRALFDLADKVLARVAEPF